MGYQESFIQFKDEKVLKNELKKYKMRNTEDDMADVVCVDRVKKAIVPFKKGELVMVVSGERSVQRSELQLEEGLGIKNVQNIVFIDNPTYWNLGNGNIGDFISHHFEVLSDEEFEQLAQ